MWNFPRILYTTRMNAILLDVASAELKQFFRTYIISEARPDEPIFPAIDSILICHMTRDRQNINYFERFQSFRACLDWIAEMLNSDRALIFKSINRDECGNRVEPRPEPLPGMPCLRVLFDFEDVEDTMSAADWGLTPVRFLLYFKPNFSSL